MDVLRSIVKAMKIQDQKDFRKFIQSQKKLDKRKDLELFDLICSNRDDLKLEQKLYGKSNKVAYHAVRKRLVRKLSDFIVLKRLEEDTTSSSSVMGLISLARYFIERRSTALAWEYLKSAEVKAKEAEQFDLLNSVYLLQIEHWKPDFEVDIHEIIDKIASNKPLVDEDERVTIASSLIKNELQKTVKESKEVDFEGITRLILSSYNLTNAVIKRPKILYNILSIGRSTILAKKDFYSFEPYLIENYRKARSQFGFTRTTHYYKLSLLYMISHVLYRNRKFDQSAEYLKELETDLFAYNNSHTLLFYSKFVLLSAAVKCYQGQLKDSIDLLSEAASVNADMFPDEDLIKLQLNLSIYHFMNQDYSVALKTGMSLSHTDKWLEKNIGKEWIFKKQIMEVIIQVDLNNEEIALNKIRSIERASTKMFSHPLYSRAKSFLELIKRMINDPVKFRSGQTQSQIEKFLMVVPEEKEDLQAMTFYAWLKAKYLRRDYYEVLLETVTLS